MKDFITDKFYFYNGPNTYLDRRALVFNLCLAQGPRVEFYEPHVLKQFPALEGEIPERVADLFAQVLVQVLKMDIDLFVNAYDVSRDGEDYVIAVEYLDKNMTEDAVYLVRDWFRTMTAEREFDFQGEFLKLQEDFDKTLYGGPTIYSLIEAGLKRGIPVNFLFEENQFQWGYGRKQIRGRSTTLHVDSIKDTEFTMFKDMVKDFLLMCGFPTPIGKNCFTEKEIVAEAEELGYPVVVKPLAGHKGQGVTTGITSPDEAIAAFKKILDAVGEEGDSDFDGALVEQQIYGTDHRLLAVAGKFAAGLERVPAYVDGDGTETIEALIEKENATVIRLDNARSPLCKIKIDDDLTEYLKLQNLTIDYVPQADERVYLRRVANISAGGVSINVTDKVHPKNVKMVEDLAGFFNVTCLGIDVLAEDISKPWDEGNFGIIEINAGPGVFMHLAPAIGESIDVPGQIIESYFPRPECSRIPIITGNQLTLGFCNLLYDHLREINPEIGFGSLTEEGVYFNGAFFCKNAAHDQNVKILLRNPKLDLAVVNHTKDNILDYGTFHEGADVVILEQPDYAAEMLERDLLPGGCLMEVLEDKIRIPRGEDEEAETYDYPSPEDKDEVLAKAVGPELKALLGKSQAVRP